MGNIKMKPNQFYLIGPNRNNSWIFRSLCLGPCKYDGTSQSRLERGNCKVFFTSARCGMEFLKTNKDMVIVFGQKTIKIIGSLESYEIKTSKRAIKLIEELLNSKAR